MEQELMRRCLKRERQIHTCSRAEMDFEMAGCDTDSASAAAEPLPVTATVRKTTS